MVEARVLSVYIPELMVCHAHGHHDTILIWVKLGSNAQEIGIVAVIHFVL
jgi:hypothetical protein